MKNLKPIEKAMIDIAIKIAKQDKGCLLILMNNPFKYSVLFEQDFKPFPLIENLRRAEVLSNVDGALIIDKEGKVINYSAKIKSNRFLKNHGTRHSAGLSASVNGNLSVLASEEDKKVRIFKDGNLIMQIDALEKQIEYKTKDAVNILELIGAGSIVTIGANTLAPSLGIMPIAGVIVFGASYFLIKKIFVGGFK